MLNFKNLAIVSVLALGAAAPSVASADRRGTGWTQLGDVGTHSHDAEDYVSVPGTRLDAIQLRARDRAVAIDGVKVQYADGTTAFVDIHRRLRPGEPFTVDVPNSRAPVKMLVLDYGNTGPFWRARETAHVQVLGLVDDNRRDKFENGERYRAPAPRTNDAGIRVDVRGGVRIR